MNSIKQRIRNIIDLIRGPFIKKGELEVFIKMTSPRIGTVSRQLSSTELRSGFTPDGFDALPMKLALANNQLKIEMPKTSVLSRATLMGWEKIWDGSQATLQGTAN